MGKTRFHCSHDLVWVHDADGTASLPGGERCAVRVVVASYEVLERCVAANVADTSHVCRAPAVTGSIRNHVSNAVPRTVVTWSSHHQDVAGKDAGAHGIAVRHHERAVQQVRHHERSTKHG